MNIPGLLKQLERSTIFLQRAGKMTYLNGMPLSDTQLRVLQSNHDVEIEDTNVWRGAENKPRVKGMSREMSYLHSQKHPHVVQKEKRQPD